MKKKTIAMTGALLIGGLLTFSSTTAFADGIDARFFKGANQPGQVEKVLGGKIDGVGLKGQKDVVIIHKQDWSTQLKTLVSDGTITQALADKIQAYLTEQENAIKAEMEKLQAMTPEQRRAYFESNKPDTIRRHDLFSEMVEKGVVTQAQADAIKARLQAIEHAKRQEEIKTQLDVLVQNKTITQDQATKIIEYVNKQQLAKTAEMDKIEAMTKEELEAYFKNNPVNRTNMLEQLVTDKVLTQEQADAVQQAIHPMGFHKGKGPGMMKRQGGFIPKTS